MSQPQANQTLIMQHLAKRYGKRWVVKDVSFSVEQGQVVGLPVQTPWVDVRSIGAGGGSIAYVDEGGLLRVGPRSAGADPGPASYGRGGKEPALTDAAFLLGMLGEGKLASGIGLDKEVAKEAFKPLADALSYSVEEAARGVMTIASATMANTIREITIDQGIDPRELSLLAFLICGG